VNVVVLNWNGGERVCATIASILNSDLSPAATIVVDNASTDGSDVEIQQHFPGVRLIRNRENLGFAAGNNVGIRHALESGADCVFLLNNDAVLEESALSVMVSALHSSPDRGAVVPKIYAQTAPGSRLLWAAGARWHPFPPRVKMRGYGDLDVGQYDDPEYVEYATACALLIHRKAFEQAGLLDESYFMYQEDYAFCDRLQSNGMKLYYQPQAVVYHRVSASTGEGSSTKWRYWSQGVARFYIQHYGSRSSAMVPLTAFLLWVMMRELSRGRLRWMRPFWQGVRAGLAEL
jgi:hypothetical protein